MTAYRKFLAFAVIITATSAAGAQATPDGEGSATPANGAPATAAPADSAWPIYPSERHVLLSVSAGPGLRLNDAWHAGIIGPWWTLIQVRGLLTNIGNLRVGASLGAQLGFDSHAGLQWAIQPGLFGMYRMSPSLGVTLRLDVPILFTRGETILTGDLGAGTTEMGVRAPFQRTTAVAWGIEAGVGGAYYVTSGVAITAEINGGAYFGDTYVYPTLGLGLGILIDYELLP